MLLPDLFLQITDCGGLLFLLLPTLRQLKRQLFSLRLVGAELVIQFADLVVLALQLDIQVLHFDVLDFFHPRCQLLVIGLQLRDCLLLNADLLPKDIGLLLRRGNLPLLVADGFSQLCHQFILLFQQLLVVAVLDLHSDQTVFQAKHIHIHTILPLMLAPLSLEVLVNRGLLRQIHARLVEAGSGVDGVIGLIRQLGLGLFLLS